MVIQEYPLQVRLTQDIYLPAEAEILSVYWKAETFSTDHLQLVARVVPGHPDRLRGISILMTGDDAHPFAKFIGTVTDTSRGVTYHVFDLGEV